MGHEFEEEDHGRPAVGTLRARYVLDSEEEYEFNLIVRQAAAAVGTRMALVSLLDGDHQWFEATIGISRSETPSAASFCRHAVDGAGVLAVGDATLDARFARNPLVTGPPFIRFYAGAVLRLDDVRVGTLCVLDDQPRWSLSMLQESYLTYLADRAVLALEARRRACAARP